jgi:hypothetical protein
MIVVTLTPGEAALLIDELTNILDERQQDFLDMTEDPSVGFTDIEEFSEKTKEIRNVLDHIKRKVIN